MSISGVAQLVGPSGNSNAERVAHRPADSELEGSLFVTSVSQGDIALHRISRPAADGVQCACGGALSRKRGLRSPYDFQPLQIEERVLPEVVAPVVDAIMKLCDSLLESLVRR